MTGNELRARRKWMKQTQADLASELDVSRVTIATWEGLDGEAIPRTAELAVEAISRLPELRKWFDDGIDLKKVWSDEMA